MGEQVNEHEALVLFFLTCSETKILSVWELLSLTRMHPAGVKKALIGLTRKQCIRQIFSRKPETEWNFRIRVTERGVQAYECFKNDHYDSRISAAG